MVLLHGPPGTGKTSLCRYELNVPTIPLVSCLRSFGLVCFFSHFVSVFFFLRLFVLCLLFFFFAPVFFFLPSFAIFTAVVLSGR